MQDFGSAAWHFLCAYNEWFFRPVPFAYLPEKPENRRIELIMERKNAWNSYSADELSRVMALAEDYRNFISSCKTERECVAESIRIAEQAGYRNLDDVIREGTRLQAGDRVYACNMGKTLALFCIGTEPMTAGLHILGAHVDSPRLDLKQNPVYEDSDICLLDTHYYGGIKKYQWVALPLAIHGVVAKKDGTVVPVVIGEDPSDPVVGISDLLIHLAGDQLQKTAAKVIEGEALNVTIGSRPDPADAGSDKKEKVKAYLLSILAEKYGIEEEDFLSAELEIVPAGPARDYGLDRSMLIGYGHDDRVCAYTSLRAMLDVENPQYTSVCLLVDKEEIGSVGATGMQSRFFENTVAELLALTCDSYNDLLLRRCLKNSKMLSSDVSIAYDPNFPEVCEPKNSAYFGRGFSFNKYTGARGKSGCNDANAEYMAYLRRVMDENHVFFQTCELGKVDQGGGGTIAYILANYDMEVIDCGVPVQNMHAPWEVVSKADVFETTKGYIAFLKAGR